MRLLFRKGSTIRPIFTAHQVLISPSIGIYRPQATFFDGRPDGKSESVEDEDPYVQILTDAGNN